MIKFVWGRKYLLMGCFRDTFRKRFYVFPVPFFGFYHEAKETGAITQPTFSQTKRSYVEVTIKGANTERHVYMNVIRTEPKGNEPGNVEMFYQVLPTPPQKDEKPEDRPPEEDLVFYLLNKLFKGVNS